jgi:hypothetical protein
MNGRCVFGYTHEVLYSISRVGLTNIYPFRRIIQHKELPHCFCRIQTSDESKTTQRGNEGQITEQRCEFNTCKFYVISL